MDSLPLYLTLLVIMVKIQLPDHSMMGSSIPPATQRAKKPSKTQTQQLLSIPRLTSLTGISQTHLTRTDRDYEVKISSSKRERSDTNAKQNDAHHGLKGN